MIEKQQHIVLYNNRTRLSLQFGLFRCGNIKLGLEHDNEK